MTLEEAKEVITWLGMVGVPSIFIMCSWCVKFCIRQGKHLDILMKAQKAQMRASLLKDYETFKTRGYILQVELDEWENQYKAYHQLVGENGILDNRRQYLFSMPNSLPITTNITRTINLEEDDVK